MNNKFLYSLIVVLIALIVGGGTYFILNRTPKQNTEQANSTAVPPSQNAAAPTAPTLSQQPDQATFNAYFADASLAKLPAGSTFSPTAIVKTSVFNLAAGEKFCTSLDLIKDIPKNSYADAIYDTKAKSYAIARSVSPRAMAVGNTLGCESLLVGPNKPLPAGTYEYKAYVNNILAIVLPFEVK